MRALDRDAPVVLDRPVEVAPIEPVPIVRPPSLAPAEVPVASPSHVMAEMRKNLLFEKFKLSATADNASCYLTKGWSEIEQRFVYTLRLVR